MEFVDRMLQRLKIVKTKDVPEGSIYICGTKRNLPNEKETTCHFCKKPIFHSDKPPDKAIMTCYECVIRHVGQPDELDPRITEDTVRNLLKMREEGKL